MNPLKRIVDGTVDDNIYKRTGWMYVSFLLIYISVTMVSYFLLPDGILRGKNPVVSALELSPDLWVSTLQIFGYNLIPTFSVIGCNLLAQASMVSKEKFVPVGYKVFWTIIVVAALILGTWSFEVVTSAPSLCSRLIRGFDILHHAMFYELSAYLLAAVTSFKFTLQYSDGKKIISSKKWKSIKLTTSEKIIFVLAFVLLFWGAFIESYGIIQLTG